MKMYKAKKLNNKGSAMIVSIIVSVVVMVFCLSLLLVSYSLYISSLRKHKLEQCKEVVKSYCLYLDDELTSPVYIDLSAMSQDLNNSKNTIWFYLRYNLRQDNWPDYIGDDVYGNDHDASNRYFDLKASGKGDGFKNYSDYVTVCMWWEDYGQEMDDFDDNDTFEGDDVLLLNIKVSCKIDDQSYSITNKYSLNISMYDDDALKGSLDEEVFNELKLIVENGNNSVNPAHNSINVNESWSFSLQERE